MSIVNETFSNVYFYKSDLNENFNQLLTALYSINHLTVYMSNIVHQKGTIYELLKESKILTKFNIYGLYSTPIALYIYTNVVQ